MTPTLTSQAVDIGTDAYGRWVTMTRENRDERPKWTIWSEPANLRDEGEIMRSLTDDNIRAMAAALEVIQNRWGAQ